MFHRIGETATIDELAFVRMDCFPELRQLFRRHGEIAIQNHEHIAGCRVEAGIDGVGFALAGLTQRLDVDLWISADHPLNLTPGAIAGMAFDENDLKRVGEARHALDGRFNIAALVARRNDNRCRARCLAEPPQ